MGVDTVLLAGGGYSQLVVEVPSLWWKYLAASEYSLPVVDIFSWWWIFIAGNENPHLVVGGEYPQLVVDSKLAVDILSW